MKEDVLRETLIQKAKETVGYFKLNEAANNSAGAVAAALITKDGNIYTGVCIELVCGMGFCAESAAVAEMLKNHETQIKMIVAVHFGSGIIPPCGRCREMLFQVDENNLDTEIVISENENKKLKELLPNLWTDQKL